MPDGQLADLSLIQLGGQRPHHLQQRRLLCPPPAGLLRDRHRQEEARPVRMAVTEVLLFAPSRRPSCALLVASMHVPPDLLPR